MTAQTTRFDPVAGEAYGLCTDCGTTMGTEDDAREHMSTTFEAAKAVGGSKGHGIRITNPGRGARIEREVSSRVDDAIQRAMEDIDNLVELGDASVDEILEALTWHSDFQDAWVEYNNEKEA